MQNKKREKALSGRLHNAKRFGIVFRAFAWVKHGFRVSHGLHRYFVIDTDNCARGGGLVDRLLPELVDPLKARKIRRQI